jgi:hypothetical protein
VTTILKHILKFVAVFTTLTLVMTITWDVYFPRKIYYCTDHVGLGYLQPGDWVHGEIEFVDEVAALVTRDMSHPDILLRGWTVNRLWMVWISMFGSSLVIAALLSHCRWRQVQSTQIIQDGQQAAPSNH